MTLITSVLADEYEEKNKTVKTQSMSVCVCARVWVA